MVMIYDISKNSAINSQQIVSTHLFCENQTLSIDVVMATEKPNRYSVYKKNYSKVLNAKYNDIREKQLSPLVKKLDALKLEDDSGWNTNLSFIRLENRENILKAKRIHSEKDELLDEIEKIKLDIEKNKECENDTLRSSEGRILFEKFLVLLSDPTYQNFKNPLLLNDIL